MAIGFKVEPQAGKDNFHKYYFLNLSESIESIMGEVYLPHLRNCSLIFCYIRQEGSDCGMGRGYCQDVKGTESQTDYLFGHGVRKPSKFVLGG